MSPFQKALSCVSPAEAKALWEALGQYCENQAEYVEMFADEPDFDETAPENLQAAQAVLDRMNAELASL